MTEEETVKLLRLLKNQAEVTMANKVKDIHYTTIADIKPDSFYFVINKAIEHLGEK